MAFFCLPIAKLSALVSIPYLMWNSATSVALPPNAEGHDARRKPGNGPTDADLPGHRMDDLNRRTMASAHLDYRWSDELELQERVALDTIADQVRNGRILDLGVGAGRTVSGLRAISQDYIGVDYVPEMVEQCRSRFPGVRFEHGDARSLLQFADGSFDLVVFSCNGICMVDHAGRIAILNEVYRLLTPHGYFVFSMTNLNDPRRHQFLTMPPFNAAGQPFKTAVRAVKFAAQTAYRLVNRLRFKRYEFFGEDYAIQNDVCHDYRTMLYSTSLQGQLRQLAAAGFQRNPLVFDVSGIAIAGETSDGTMTFVVAK